MSEERATSTPAASSQAGVTNGAGIPYVCPRCQAGLADRGKVVVCTKCAGEYPRLDMAYADFAPGIGWDDWWTESPEAIGKFMTDEVPREEEYQAGLARRYMLPLLAKLGYRPSRASVLAAGCGLAADVDALNEEGYAAWGIDCGNRVRGWSRRRHSERLARADATNLPFPDASFDFVTALNLLEHVGTEGKDLTTVEPDYERKRLDVMRSLLRVTKPGGYVLLSGPNRHFPIDPFHTQHSTFVRFHSPWERFLLSYGDNRRLAFATGYADWTQPLPIRGFFSWTHMRHNPLVRPLLPVVDWLLGGLPTAFYGSWFSFLTIVLVHRRADAQNGGPKGRV
jgi:SAM-dependent methyltransferase